MKIADNSVFLCYRRTNFPWALAVWQHLTQHGFDVFIDYYGAESGDFESVILENIRARAHFIIILTPSALERFSDPSDFMRREIEAALANRRNIISLMMEDFDFGSAMIASRFTGTLSILPKYQGLRVPNEFFESAMERLRSFLSIPLAAVIHPPSAEAQEAAAEQSAAAAAAEPVQDQELTAQQYFERGYASSDCDEKIRFYSEAIRRKTDYSEAYNNRGIAHGDKGNWDDALKDHIEAVRHKPDNVEAHVCLGGVRALQGDVEGALRDFEEAIRLKPDFADAYYNRGWLFREMHQDASAISDLQRYLSLGGGTRNGNTEKVEVWIRKLQEKLETNAANS